jgi:hypothetical protein
MLPKMVEKLFFVAKTLNPLSHQSGDLVFAEVAPNYAIKGTSVDTLHSNHTAGASVPNFGC